MLAPPGTEVSTSSCAQDRNLNVRQVDWTHTLFSPHLNPILNLYFSVNLPLFESWYCDIAT